MTGAYNTASGVSALQSNTTGTQNTASGVQALYSNTTGYYNTASGVNALYFNTTGFNNTASGVQALYSNTTGTYNTASGVNSLQSNTSGTQNSAVGFSSLTANTIGSYNTANGTYALASNTIGSQNISIGYASLYSNTTGFGNVALGSQSGYGDGTANMQSTVDNYATFLGYQASRDASVASTTPLTNITAIGKNARVGASNTIVLGGTGADAVNVGIGTVTPAYKLDVAGSIVNSAGGGTLGNGSYPWAGVYTSGLTDYGNANITGSLNIGAGSAYMYNGMNVITASTTLSNYFFGGQEI